MRSILKKLFTAFWRRNLAFSQLAVVTNLEYRFNFFIDAILQPTIAVGIEIILWISVFSLAETTSIGGFGKDMYLAYAVWAPFLGRIGVSWMYEAMMVEEVSAGNINIILTRPISFYEYYLSQLLGYKVVTTLVSLMVPLLFTVIYKLPIHYDRLPIAFCLVFLYLFFLHNLSFIVSSMAFYITKVKSFTLVKNLILWLLAGELLPIDLMSPALSKILLWLPFSASVYIPVAYVTGRCDQTLVMQGFISIVVGFAITSLFARLLWVKGLSEYTGTGA